VTGIEGANRGPPCQSWRIIRIFCARTETSSLRKEIKMEVIGQAGTDVDVNMAERTHPS